MKLHRIIITNYRQFGKFDLKLTYPDDYANQSKRGKPLDKVCFIGKNGTGKSTLLLAINELFKKGNIRKEILSEARWDGNNNGNPFYSGYAFIFENDKGDLFLKGTPGAEKRSSFAEPNPSNVFVNISLAKIELGENFIEDVFLNFDSTKRRELYQYSDTYNRVDGYKKYADEYSIMNAFHTTNNNLLIYSPLEEASNNGEALTVAWNTIARRNDASYYNQFPIEIEIAYSSLKLFWSLIIFQTLQRDKKRAEFENLPENLQKKKIELINEFNKQQPDFLKLLANKWDKILSDCGLYFDYETAIVPQTLEDSFHAYIKRKKDGRTIQYHQLSTGIRNFIFRLGYLYSLYFDRNIQSGIALFDEPEYSLHPELLRDVIGYYTNKEDFPNTQFFFATHNATIASQFEPEERVILEFNDDYEVEPKKGSAPEGDDPNDILLQDFGISNTMTTKGVEKWKEYLEYRKKAQTAIAEEEKEEYLSKAMEIAMEYKFGKDATDSKK